MREMTCITCPNGCRLLVEEEDGRLVVTGNRCERGKKFAVAEMTHPMRTICTTVRTIYKNVPVLPVRVNAEIPKEKIFDVMKEINKVEIKRTVGTGDIVIHDVLGLGVDVIVTSNILKQQRQ